MALYIRKTQNSLIVLNALNTIKNSVKTVKIAKTHFPSYCMLSYHVPKKIPIIKQLKEC